jgi:ribosome-associated protein
MARRAAPHRGIDIHYGDAGPEDHGVESEGEGEAEAEHPGRPSKTKLKQHSHDLQTLGVAVSELSNERLAAIEMPDALRDAIEAFRRTRSHEGRRRQMQYVGKLMRSADEAALREAVAAATLGSAKETLMLHETERWRAELIADDEAMTRWLSEHPDTDTQQLRSLVRAARRDAAAAEAPTRQPRSFRDLFQFLKPMLSAP